MIGWLALVGCNRPVETARPVPAAPVGGPLDQAVHTTGLPPELAARTLAWPARLERAKTSSDALCAAVVEAAELAGALQPPLFERRDAVFDDPVRDDPYRAGVEVLDHALVGLHLAVGAETFYAGVSYDELATVPTDPASAALLEATHGLLLVNYPVWMEQTSDLGGCSRPDRAQAPIAALAASWAQAPACLQAALRPKLAASLDALAGRDCFCEDEATIRAALGALEPALEALEKVGGPARVKPNPGPDARYGDACAG